MGPGGPVPREGDVRLIDAGEEKKVFKIKGGAKRRPHAASPRRRLAGEEGLRFTKSGQQLSLPR